MLAQAVGRFNDAADRLQTTEFRRARTSDEWKRITASSAPRHYRKLFDAVLPFLEAYTAARERHDRSVVADQLTTNALSILRTFAGAMPVLAVRQKSPALIEQGLTVLTVLGEVDDTRDLTFYLATLYHAATKLEIDAVGLFRGVACMCPSTAPSTFLRDAMSGFPLRRAEDRDLRAFWLREAVTDEGFGFAQAGK